MTRKLVAAGMAALLGSAPFALAGGAPPAQGKQLPDGGSLRPSDSGLIPEAAGLPDTLTPPILRDGATLDARPVPL